MVEKEYHRTRKDGVKIYKSYSTEGYYIQKKGTDEVDKLFFDVENAPYEYVETSKKIEVM